MAALTKPSKGECFDQQEAEQESSAVDSIAGLMASKDKDLFGDRRHKATYISSVEFLCVYTLYLYRESEADAGARSAFIAEIKRVTTLGLEPRPRCRRRSDFAAKVDVRRSRCEDLSVSRKKNEVIVNPRRRYEDGERSRRRTTLFQENVRVECLRGFLRKELLKITVQRFLIPVVIIRVENWHHASFIESCSAGAGARSAFIAEFKRVTTLGLEPRPGCRRRSDFAAKVDVRRSRCEDLSVSGKKNEVIVNARRRYEDGERSRRRTTLFQGNVRVECLRGSLREELLKITAQRSLTPVAIIRVEGSNSVRIQSGPKVVHELHVKDLNAFQWCCAVLEMCCKIDHSVKNHAKSSE
ncbi:hypothetical protein CAPTEDRAFT_189097 [Capitella teleta]|uniref:Uncharacterized protein n=1 Tax=Capitella teleta TaxID=283909 RepID=R7T7C4_CAPTE|nr:hypothetical protein CAPTEDRAFT_189097 [Capitella teleta]|eukprot:ELT87305.1 hypothetical protein CAPTEDRAFT_189097 [Capitella teleta]